jgi:uncharacterized protein YkwD
MYLSVYNLKQLEIVIGSSKKVIMPRIIKLFLILAMIITGTLACDEPSPVKITKAQSTQVSQPQNKVAEPPTIIKQQTPATPESSSIPTQAQQQVTPPIQTSQPSGTKSLNVPAYLFSEGQSVQNRSNSTLNQAQDSSMAGQVLALINNARVANGLSQVVRDGFLDSLALQHSQDMVKTNVMSHEGFDNRANTIITTLGAHCVGENVAMGYNTAASLVQGWLDSPGHRQNIMNPLFRKMGIGIAGIFATQMFSD